MGIKYIRKNSIPIRYCIFDENGNLVDYSPGVYRAMAKIRVELTKHIENEVSNIFAARQSSVESEFYHK